MHRLIEGALRFQAEIHGLHREVAGENAGQAPFAMFMACSGSRVAPKILTQREPGDIFRFVALTLGKPVHATPKSRLAYPVLHGNPE